MSRSILRNIQNSLVIMSLVLCILAFQRLESLDVVHKSSPPSSTWPYPPPYTERFSEDDSSSRDSKPSLFELVFGRELPARWFCLSEIWKRHGPINAMPPAIAWHDSFITQSKNLRGSSYSSTLNIMKSKSEKKQDEQVAILVTMDSCKDKNTVDTAALLEETLSKHLQDVRLYALVVNSKAMSQCKQVLPYEYELVSFEQAFPSDGKTDVSCLTTEQKALLFAHSLENIDTVAYVPLPSIAVVPFASDTIKKEKHSSTVDEPARHDEKEASSILTTRPQGKESVEKFARLCHDKESSSQETFKGWQPCGNNDEGVSSCRLTKTISIATFQDCSMMPLTMDDKVKTTNSDDSKGHQSNECQYLQEQWRQAKDDVTHRSKQNSIDIKSA